MSKFIPQNATIKEQYNQAIRRGQTMLKNKPALDLARAQLEAVPVDVLKSATPDTLEAFKTLREVGLTERYTLAVLGSMFGDILRANLKAAKTEEKAKA